MFVDTHCHLDRIDCDREGASLSVLLERAREAGVQRFLSVATDLERLAALREIAAAHEDVFMSVGVHPLSDEIDGLTHEMLASAAASASCVAIGETGLDYYYQQDTRAAQQAAFIAHLEVAGALKKPVIVHSREAKADTLALIRNHADPSSAGVIHCFTEDWEMARSALDLNFYISFSGIVTFRNASALREVARRVPLDRLLVETDAPYLAPVPHRGQQNVPAYVMDVGRFIAELRGVPDEELAAQTTANFFRLFPEAS